MRKVKRLGLRCEHAWLASPRDSDVGVFTLLITLGVTTRRERDENGVGRTLGTVAGVCPGRACDVLSHAPAPGSLPPSLRPVHIHAVSVS